MWDASRGGCLQLTTCNAELPALRAAPLTRTAVPPLTHTQGDPLNRRRR